MPTALATPAQSAQDGSHTLQGLEDIESPTV